MLTLYTNYNTPNGMKVVLLLAELQIEHKVIEVDFAKNEQLSDAFLQISPNNKIPVITEKTNSGNIAIFESGAIMLYLAEKTEQFIPKEPQARSETIVWLFWQNASLGPMLGQAHHFSTFAPEKITYALERYTNEAQRLYKVLNKRLVESQYLGGNEISIADLAAYPWVNEARHAAQGIKIEKYPQINAWLHKIAQRPAIAEAYQKHPQKPLAVKHFL